MVQVLALAGGREGNYLEIRVIMGVISDSAVAQALSLYGQALPVGAVDWARSLPEKGTALVGGFHSPIEQECLVIALRRWLAIVVCVARDLDTMRLPSQWTQAINDGRMLLLSTFSPSDRRLTEERSHERNRFAALLADEIFIVHADSGSRTEQLGRYAREKGKRLVAPA